MMNRKEHIQHLYEYVLGREADEGGLNHYLNSDLSLYQIQFALWQSDEFKSKFNIPSYDPSPIDNKISIFVINLKRRPDRKELIETKLKNLGISNYEIVEAVDGRELPEDTSEFYNNEESNKFNRELNRNEIGCSLSHIAIAKIILERNLDYAIILEDDAEIDIKFKTFIKTLELEENKFDFLILGSCSSNQFFNGKAKIIKSPYRLIEKESIIYLDDIEFKIGDVSIHKPYYPSLQLDFICGTHAYMLSNKGAKKLLELNYPVRVEADNVWNYFHDKLETLFTNPIVVHRQHEDSDIKAERSKYDNNFESFSDNFKSRKDHQDFGT